MCLNLGQRPVKKRFNYQESSSSQSSKLSVEHLNSMMDWLKYSQHRSSTMANYFGIWRSFNNFLIHLDYIPPGTSWEEKTMLFGVHLVDTGCQSSTIKSYFSAIKHILKTDGYPWSNDKIMLVTLTRSCKLLNDSVKVRLPISYRLLDAILFEIERCYGDNQPYLEIMYKAAFSLAYYGLMRVGELTSGSHPVQARDVHMAHSKDSILLLLRTSKTHGKRNKPQRIKICTLNLPKLHKKFFCPFRIVSQYITNRGNYMEDEEPFLVFSDRTPVTPNHFRCTLRCQLQKLDLDPTLYDTHSFRIGQTSDMYNKFHYTIDQIHKAGRWKSSAIFKYIKP